jgi:hypothetical protein
VASIEYTSNRFFGGCFSHFPYPERLRRPRRGQPLLFRVQKNPEIPHFKQFLRHLSVHFFSFARFASLP